MIINVLLPLCSYWMAPKILVTVTVLYFLIFLIPVIAVKVRRLHDVNKSGWWLLIAFTGIGYFVLLYWYCCRGTLGANYYGEDEEAGRS